MAVGFEKLVKDTADTIKKAGDRKTSEHNAVGVVKRVDGKTAWVHFNGGVDETPVKMTIGANVGDKVRVHIGGGKAYIIGNETSPPTDDRQANKAIQYTKEVEKTADTATEKIEDIEYLVGDGEDSGITISTQYYLSSSNTELVDGEWTDVLPVYQAGYYYWIKTVTVYADGSEIESEPMLDINNQITAEVNAVVTAENQHFWHDSSGAYVTNAEGSYSSGYAMKITTYGLLQTYNGNNLMSLTNSGLSFYQSDGSTPLATYSSGGATIYGGSTGSYASVDSTGLKIYNSGLVASFGSSANIGSTSGYNLGLDPSNGVMIKSSSTTVLRMFGYGGGARMSFTNIKLFASGASEDAPTVNISSSGVYALGTISSSGNINAGGSLSVGSTGTLNSIVAGNSVSTYNLGMGSAYRLGVYSSSKDKKTDISYKIEDEFNPHQLYNLPVVTFRWKDEYKDPDAWDKDRKQIGFIAEDVHDAYYVGAIHDSAGKTIDWSHRTIIPAMLYLIQEQKKEIDLLAERVKILEERSIA